VVRGRAVATGYVQRLGFFAIEYITFQGRQKRSDEEWTKRRTEVAELGCGRVEWGSDSLSLKNVFKISFFYNLGIG